MDANGIGSESTLAAAIKAGRYPSSSTLTALEDSGEALTTQRELLSAAIDEHPHFRDRLQSALQGQAGDAALAAHDANRRLWEAHEDLYGPAATAVTNAVGELRRLQNMLQDLIEATEPQFKAALECGDHVAAQSILIAATGEADGMVTEHAGNAESHIKAVNFTAPLSPAPPGGQKSEGGKHSKQTDPHPPKAAEDAAGSGPAPHDKNTPIDGGPADPGEPSSPLHGKQTPAPPAIPGGPVQMPFPATQMGSGGGSGLGSGGGGLSGLGSGLRPPSGGMSGLGAPTSPASAMPQAPSSAGSAAPLANVGSSFQSGLASGMGATGGMTTPVTPPAQQPTAPIAATQPPVAAQTSAGAGIGPAGVPAGSSWSGPVDSAAASGGHGASGGGGLSGGGGMMPPAGMAGQPLAPYSAPGVGAPGGGSPSAPTTAAGGGTAGQAATGGAGTAGGGPGTPPMLTGNPGSSAAMSALAGSSTDVNPDLLTAQRVLGELVRGSEDSSALVLWAVAVLRSPVGPHIVVANNVGGGGYLPQKVYLPTTVRLAVSDPSLPTGWAGQWMGCQKPSKILVDYFDRLRKVIAGVTVSALVTTELWAEPPHDFAGDFQGIEHRDALRLISEAPKLDAAHQHRLAVMDPGLAQRVNGLDRGGDVSARCAAVLTGVLFQAATTPDSTGAPLVEKADADILQAVSNGTVNPDTWATYGREVDQRHGSAVLWPQQHAPSDNDGSDIAQASILWYLHYYRIGRMIELIRCWKARPPRLVEVAYCGITAGFGPTVVNAIGAMEQQLAGVR